MALLGAFITVVGLGALFYGCYGLFKWRGHRKRALLIVVVSIVATPLLVGVVAVVDSSQEKEAFKKSGFSAIEEFRHAKKQGFLSKADYDQYLTTAKAEERRIAEEKAETEAQERRIAEEKELACKKNLQCWGDKFNASVGLYCDDFVVRLAKYSHEWTDGILEPKFSHFRWKDKSSGIITYIGDKVKFQNGYGAWSNMVYECDFDPTNNSVLDVRVRPGRL